MRMARSIRIAVLLAVAALVLAGCSKSTERKKADFEKVQKGMTSQQVIDLMGKPDQTLNSSTTAAGVEASVTVMAWKCGDQALTVCLLKNEVISKSVDNRTIPNTGSG